MKKLPIGIQSFSKLIEGDYLYIDKTKGIHNLINKGALHYFISRPRRFGKSLLVSTLAELFAGNKELFKGLWIYDKIEWTKYPVIHLDLSKISFKTPEMLENALEARIEKIASQYDIQLNKNFFLKEKFGELLELMAQKQKVVLLIDEYDKPLIEYVETDQLDTAKSILSVLKNFFAVIKGSDAYLRFVFLTGVSKFSKVSVFSDLNNLIDITLMKDYATLFGYTQSELEHYFADYMKETARELSVSQTYLADTLKQWYNGYSWDGLNYVYNPYSILNFFRVRSFGNFWFSTGTPTFLMKCIKGEQVDIRELEHLLIDSYTFDCFDIENMDVAALLFQTGYLTVKRVTIEKEEKTYELSYPNHEVKNSFLTHLLGMYTQKKMGVNTRILKRIGKAVDVGDMETFINELTSLFASIPYNIFIGEKEAYYHSIIYLVLSLTGARINSEDPTNLGRIDAALETENKIYIMEFKMGDSQAALNQIKQMKYYEKYLNKGKDIILMGIGFDSEKRNIGDFLQEPLITDSKS